MIDNKLADIVLQAAVCGGLFEIVQSPKEHIKQSEGLQGDWLCILVLLDDQSVIGLQQDWVLDFSEV